MGNGWGKRALSGVERGPGWCLFVSPQLHGAREVLLLPRAPGVVEGGSVKGTR